MRDREFYGVGALMGFPSSDINSMLARVCEVKLQDSKVYVIIPSGRKTHISPPARYFTHSIIQAWIVDFRRRQLLLQNEAANKRAQATLEAKKSS
jgi:hypothetical protein